MSNDEENDEKFKEEEMEVNAIWRVHNRDVDNYECGVDQNQTQNAWDMSNEPH